MYRFLPQALLIVLTAVSAAGATAEHRIAVLARGADRIAPQRFDATADYLSRQIPGETFVVVPLTRAALDDAIAGGDVAFAITDPGDSVYLQTAYGATPLATAQDSWHGAVYSTIAAAVIARADRPDLAWMSDLKGKSFMADSRNSFGGFQIAWWELKAHDIDPFRDFSRLIFSNVAPEAIVDAVRAGRVDAAVVESGALERMADEDGLDLNEFRVMHPHTAPGYPFARSTELYPAWTLLKAPETPDELGQRVAAVLRSMPAQDPGAPGPQPAAWVAPADTAAVRELLRDLHLPPYGDAAEPSVAAVVRRYWTWLALIFVLVLSLVAMVLHVWRVNRRLDLSRRYLERARTLEAQFAHAGRVAAIGEMGTVLAHELNQPLAAIVNYAKGCIRRLASDEMSPKELATILDRIAAEGNRSAEILRRLRDFIGKRKALHAPADANRIVREATDLAELEARQKAVKLRLELSDGIAPVIADPVQIEQVVLNLVHNAIEAIDNAKWQQREVIVQTQQNPRKGVDVTVRDTGPGLPANGVERMFEPFVSTKPGGMGLGLSISRSIVEAHGGRLRAIPGPGGGATFSFTLPTVAGRERQ